jgi:hypothetical protein
MHPPADFATLNVQPRQRRTVYELLATLPAGRSVRDLLDDFEMPESELRETLRKLDQAGLARRGKGVWQAIPIEQPIQDSTTEVVA